MSPHVDDNPAETRATSRLIHTSSVNLSRSSSRIPAPNKSLAT